MTHPIPAGRDLVSSAAAALKSRIDEVNRLNVFPVPDGDTGTNMSLTMDTVVAEVAKVDPKASVADLCHAVTHGSLMGARGNSGVILSQVLRGLCEGVALSETFDAEALAVALERSSEVAYQAVRKPVEGTMLTVIRETSLAARAAADASMPLPDALEAVRSGAFESVRRTPELLEVLRENGVVDAGGFGLAILVDGFVAAALGGELTAPSIEGVSGDMHVEPADDWDDDEYLYCTEFLLFGDDIDREAIGDYLAQAGGSELIVGDGGSYKVHVHTNDPGAVLAHVTGLGEVAEVHVNNMRRQKSVRDASISAIEASAPRKPVGFVAVAVGAGFAEILRSLGADVVVNGGQTMNPSTKDLAEAIASVNADKVIVLPNNKNILMAAQAAASVSDRPVGVVPTRSVPQAFSALLAFEGDDDVDAIVASMTEAAGAVRTGEVTTAVKDAKGKVGEIKTGQVIGIVDDEDIEAVGDDVTSVALKLAHVLADDGDAETLTLFAGADFSDAELASLAKRVGAEVPGVELETHRGEQPLYPVVLSAE